MASSTEETVVRGEEDDGNITSTSTSNNIHQFSSALAPDLTTVAPVKSSSSSRFSTLRKWFKPWKWRRSKRHGEMRTKSAEMEDVDAAGTTVLAARPSLQNNDRILNQSLSSKTLVEKRLVFGDKFR